MSSLPVYNDQNAPSSEAREALNAVKGKYGFLPNLMGELAGSHPVLQAYLQLGDQLAKTSLTATEQQLILIAISRDNGCDYCVAAHSAVATMSKVDQDVIDAARNGTDPSDSKLAALVRFTRTVVAERGWVSDADVQQFLEAGYTQANILDVILAVSFKTISNYTNHIAKTPLDENFSQFKWERS